MLTLLSETETDFIACLISQKLEPKDLEALIPLLENAIEAHQRIRFYLELRDFEGLTAASLWAGSKFDLQHRDHFSHIALVGEHQWQAWLTGLMEPFTSADVRFFAPHEREVALQWARQTPDRKAA